VPGGAPQVLGGPIWWFVFGVYAGSLVLAAYVIVDSLRPTRLATAPLRLREPLALYMIGEAVFLALALVVWIPAVVARARWLAAVPVLLTPFAIALGVAYLLRVVFPKPPSGSGRRDETAPADAGPARADAAGDDAEPAARS